MSWLRDEDDMLDHEAWRRAIREGGADTLLIWFRLRAWCARRLTDGVVPADMVDEVGGISGKTKLRALRALTEASLVAWCASDDDALNLCRGDIEPSPKHRRDFDEAIPRHRRLIVVGYLKRQPSRASVLAERDRRAQSEKLRRDKRGVTGHDTAHARDRDFVDVPPRDNHPSQSRPNPVPFHSQKSDPPTPSSDLEPPPDPPPIGAETSWESYPKGWHWSAETEAAAAMQGVTPAQLQEQVDYWTTHKWRVLVIDLDGELRRSIPTIRSNGEATRARSMFSTVRAEGKPGAGWGPNQLHREYCERRGLDNAEQARVFYRSGALDRLSPSECDTAYREQLVAAAKAKRRADGGTRAAVAS